MVLACLCGRLARSQGSASSLLRLEVLSQCLRDPWMQVASWLRVRGVHLTAHHRPPSTSTRINQSQWPRRLLQQCRKPWVVGFCSCETALDDCEACPEQSIYAACFQRHTMCTLAWREWIPYVKPQPLLRHNLCRCICSSHLRLVPAWNTKNRCQGTSTSPMLMTMIWKIKEALDFRPWLTV